MKLKKKFAKLAVGLSMIVLVTGITGCSNNTVNQVDKEISSVKQEEVDKKEDEKLVLRLEGSNTGLPNPFRHTARGPGIAKMQLLYDSLMEKDESGDIPWLAENWDISEDGTVYTFNMRENAFWHDGEPLTAEDVEFTISYYKDHPPVSNTLLAGGKFIVDKAEALDSHTVKITLNGIDNTYLTKIGSVRILPKHIWQNVSDPYSFTGEGSTVGSGPYKFEFYDEQQGAYRYAEFDNYWGLRPVASAIEWIPVSDKVLAFENQEIDLINAAADILIKYKSDSQYTIKTSPSYHSYRLMLNMDAVPELADKNLRKAIAYGIDSRELVDKVARGAATVSSAGYVPTYSTWYNSDVEQYEYNQEKSLELLGGKVYSFTLLTDNSSEGTKAAELIKLSLENIGIEVKVKSVESKTRDNAVKTGEYELLLINSGGIAGDPDYLRTVFGKESKTVIGWSDEEIYTLLENQAVEMSEKVRKETIYKIQEKIADDLPMIMLYGTVDNFVFRSEKHDGWMFRYDHSKCDHNKLSYLVRE